MLKFKSLFLLLFPLMSCAHPTSQDGCSFLRTAFGERVSWKSDVPVTLFFHESFPEEYKEAAEYAANMWNKKAGKKLLQFSDTIIRGPIKPVRDNLNIIYYDLNYSNSEVEQAYTATKWVGDKMVDADIVVNGKTITYYTRDNIIRNAVSMETLMAHELGHLLGLSHSKNSIDIMYPYLPTNIDKSGLETFDENILKCEY